MQTEHKTTIFNCIHALLNLKFHTFYILLSFNDAKQLNTANSGTFCLLYLPLFGILATGSSLFTRKIIYNVCKA